MKNLYTRAIIDLLYDSDADGIMEDGVAITKAELIDALNHDLNRAHEKKQAKMEAYNIVHDSVIDTLSANGALTCVEIFDEIKYDFPKDFTRPMLQYALNNLWDDIEVADRTPVYTYRVKGE